MSSELIAANDFQRVKSAIPKLWCPDLVSCEDFQSSLLLEPLHIGNPKCGYANHPIPTPSRMDFSPVSSRNLNPVSLALVAEI